MYSASKANRKSKADSCNNVINIFSAMDSNAKKEFIKRASNTHLPPSKPEAIAGQNYQLKLVANESAAKDEDSNSRLPSWLMWLLPESLIKTWKK
ncbi:hypothetical protein [Litorilituus sediminis]|uniref:Uncharacterized protein n=1 Tax=Litorilituus sediminis TaxID=718192 RepID=A0A4P6P8G7_9GAMM|nr:hypothetical protein [Litorilituus sediminis]QBG35852.1 hypothetical protein EMK97_09060 [Litorilituus sediminis]